MANDIKLSDENFAALSQHFDTPRLLDLFGAICSYCGTVRMLAALQVDVEPDYAVYLERFPLPKD
jgi:hypothetical protein